MKAPKQPQQGVGGIPNGVLGRVPQKNFPIEKRLWSPLKWDMNPPRLMIMISKLLANIQDRADAAHKMFFFGVAEAQ